MALKGQGLYSSENQIFMPEIDKLFLNRPWFPVRAIPALYD
jgi:hypothetical protein